MQTASDSLLDRLRTACEAWSSATGRTLGALSGLVTNQGSFFERLGLTRNGVSTTTLEKFARFLGEADNWPESVIATEAVEFVHVVLGSDEAARLSPDDPAENIGSADLHSEAPADPAAVPTGHAEPTFPPVGSGASGRSPGTESVNASGVNSVPGDFALTAPLGGAA